MTPDHYHIFHMGPCVKLSNSKLVALLLGHLPLSFIYYIIYPTLEDDILIQLLNHMLYALCFNISFTSEFLNFISFYRGLDIPYYVNI